MPSAPSRARPAHPARRAEGPRNVCFDMHSVIPSISLKSVFLRRIQTFTCGMLSKMAREPPNLPPCCPPGKQSDSKSPKSILENGVPGNATRIMLSQNRFRESIAISAERPPPFRAPRMAWGSHRASNRTMNSGILRRKLDRRKSMEINAVV